MLQKISIFGFVELTQEKFILWLCGVYKWF